MLDTSLLEDFMAGFLGYGDLSAPHWFVGMEEGGGSTEKELRQRLRRWVELGRVPVVDNYEFHQRVENAAGESMSYFFDGRPKIQRTWAGLIRILLAVAGEPDDSAERVRAFQANELGRSSSDNCLLELLPLPSPGMDTWKYGEWSDLGYLSSREAYRGRLLAPRVTSLRQLVKEHRPRCVVFYSVSPDYLERWSEIAGFAFDDVEAETMCTGNQGQRFAARLKARDGTLFVAIYHPVYTGLTKEYFRAVGAAIRARTT